jgi:hypothetical protein
VLWSFDKDDLDAALGQIEVELRGNTKALAA